ncbi:uncharacterized protein LOC142333444 [Lycorma delicatula]|uniref:uncharacterized protein LOC142333444 n=1 Tax=Lycorma delicatula TaxID=130591 RepID=UPI003F517792
MINLSVKSEVFFKLFIGMLILSNIINLISTTDVNTNIQQYCPDFHSQRSLDLDQLMGMWYGVEVIQHRSDRGYAPGVTFVDSCPVLHFSKRDKPSELQLYWSEKAGTVEYQFNILNPSNPGFWMSFGPQNGSMVHKTYRQFAGVVQVMKAVASHVVLTFCSPNSELYTIILSRKRSLDKLEIRGVRNLLSRRQLNQYGIRETNCNSSGASLKIKSLYLPLFILLIFIKKYFSDY